MKGRDRRISIALLIAALAATTLATWRDCASEIAGLLRAQAPISGLVWTRYQGQGRVIPPAVYIPFYLPATRRLEIVSVHSSSPLPDPGSRETLGDVYSRSYYATGGDVRRASRVMADQAMRILATQAAWPPGTPAPAFRLELELPLDSAADPAAVKELLTAWYSDPLFWLRLAGRLAALSRGEAPGLSRYDAVLLAWTLSRLDPGRIGLSLLPAPKMVPAFFAAALGSAPRPQPGPVTAEVLNSSNSGGVAMKATKVLRSHGIDVVHFGNARAREASTRVIDRVGLPSGAKDVVDALGCPGSEVLTEMESQPRAAVTVVLGQDFKLCTKLRD